ncbi:homeobox protein NANOG-like [Simochromis diagramma]|uniref:homeobox protein NANOG-like n=1 Tax=Simochromis diagramma TaxID=43689 RepID=UPI001A7E6057|nr:homeobox protein NANOG-like [Simochromis diagramma]
MEMINKTTDTSEAVSISVSEQKQDFAVPRSQDGNITATLHHPSTAPEKPKGKARVVFTERQLIILVHHFNAKHYYEPREIKQLAEMTGLTYRQVKTWFQNRRSKFRRRSHSQHVNQGVPLHGEGQPPLGESYTQHLEVNSITNGANYQGPYHHPVDNFAAGPQWTFPTSPRMFGWSMPPGNVNKGGWKGCYGWGMVAGGCQVLAHNPTDDHDWEAYQQPGTLQQEHGGVQQSLSGAVLTEELQE